MIFKKVGWEYKFQRVNLGAQFGHVHFGMPLIFSDGDFNEIVGYINLEFREII